ncbi:hypothetical protein [Piscirickettsia salmonis]|uniref:hypothetical protein n=1 Tax=Piscirickettsia salmonis TaxID=1238 RepID=UPI0027A0701C|nr:hypothetical protein E3220_08565 [Piscirickettsia salmonis EM-90]
MLSTPWLAAYDGADFRQDTVPLHSCHYPLLAYAALKACGLKDTDEIPYEIDDLNMITFGVMVKHPNGKPVTAVTSEIAQQVSQHRNNKHITDRLKSFVQSGRRTCSFAIAFSDIYNATHSHGIRLHLKKQLDGGISAVVTDSALGQNPSPEDLSSSQTYVWMKSILPALLNNTGYKGKVRVVPVASEAQVGQLCYDHTAAEVASHIVNEELGEGHSFDRPVELKSSAEYGAKGGSRVPLREALWQCHEKKDITPLIEYFQSVHHSNPVTFEFDRMSLESTDIWVDDALAYLKDALITRRFLKESETVGEARVSFSELIDELKKNDEFNYLATKKAEKLLNQIDPTLVTKENIFKFSNNQHLLGILDAACQYSQNATGRKHGNHGNHGNHGKNSIKALIVNLLELKLTDKKDVQREVLQCVKGEGVYSQRVGGGSNHNKHSRIGYLLSSGLFDDDIETIRESYQKTAKHWYGNSNPLPELPFFRNFDQLDSSQRKDLSQAIYQLAV